MKGKLDQLYDINNMSLEELTELSSSVYDYILENINNEDERRRKITFKLRHREFKLRLSKFVSNTILWSALKVLKVEIRKRHIFKGAWTEDKINNYLNDYVISPHISIFNKEKLNIICATAQEAFTRISDEMGIVLGSTIDLYSDIKLMRENPEYNELLTGALPDNVQLDNVEDILMSKLNDITNIIKENPEHCLYPYIQAKQGVSPAQLKEYHAGVGTKPDGNGSIFPKAVKESFLQGVSSISGHYIESTKGRIAQVMSKNNVGSTGDLARKFNLLNRDTTLHPDEEFDCGTTNYLKVEIRDIKDAELIKLRYVKLHYFDNEFIVNKDNIESLVGKTILMRSPHHCASEKVCKKCYGELYYLNRDIVAGQFGASQCTNSITQLMLSAKHVLKSNAVKMAFPDDIEKLFSFRANILIADNFSGYTLIIEPSEIEYDGESASINTISIKDDSTGEIYNFDIDDNNIYLTEDVISKLQGETIEYISPTTGMELFYIEFKNNEISELFTNVKGLINTNNGVDKTLEEFYSAGRDILCRRLNIPTIHYEIATRMQIRSNSDILKLPDWRLPNNTNYRILTVNNALLKYPSVSVSLSFQKLKNQLHNPYSFKKSYASQLDPFFMK